jgi:hypothetical protein
MAISSLTTEDYRKMKRREARLSGQFGKSGLKSLSNKGRGENHIKYFLPNLPNPPFGFGWQMDADR